MNQHAFLTSLVFTNPEESFPKGQHMLRQDQPASAIYYLTEGTVKVFSVDEDGNQIIYALVSPGEFIGLTELFGSDTFFFSAQTLEESRAVRLEKKDLRDHLIASPQLMDLVLLELGRKLTDAYDRNHHLLRLRVRERMAHCLLELAEQFGVHEADEIRIRLRLNREEIAALIGVAPETAIRFLSEFKKKNYISESDHQLIIRNRKPLEDICDPGSTERKINEEIESMD